MRPTALILATALLPAAALAAETVSTPADRALLSLTVYQGDVGLVRDRRVLELDKGPSRLVIEGVAREARPGSGQLAAAGVAVRDHGFAAPGLDTARLLAASVGREVTVVWPGSGKEERAVVLAAEPVPLFRVGGKVVAGQPERVLFDALPDGLRPLPAWTASVEAASAGKREADFSYLTGGLDWRADYTAQLDGDRMVLAGWATLTNTSGADFADARVRVVAGTLNQAPRPPRPLKAGRAEMAMAASMDAAAPEAAGPYHVYALPRPVTLGHGDTRQVALTAPATVEVERALTLDPLPPHAWRDRWAEPEQRHPTLQLRFKNGLGQPLPAGVVRVTQATKDGAPLLVGEDRLEATPDGAAARIVLGEAFDVTARRVQTDFLRVSSEVTEAAWEVKLANAGDKPARVTVRERFDGEWLVVDESAKHLRDGAFTAAWTVTVPAKGETMLKYRARVKP